MKPLAVATGDPTRVAHTYVRQHMDLLVPGGTVGIAIRGSAPDDARMPFFARGPRKGGTAGTAVATLGNLLRAGYSDALDPGDETAVMAFLREHGVGAVLAEFGTTGLVMRRACKRLGLRHVVNFHGFDATVLPQRRQIRWGYRLLARDADAIVCGSRHFASIVKGLGFPEDRLHVIPCGVETSDFLASGDRDGRTVIAIGRLTKKKRPDLTVRAFASAKRMVRDLRLEMIGDGPERPRCEAAIRDCGVGDSVVLHGAQPHDVVKRRLAGAGIFVQHSMTAPNGDQESQGISLLEAMSAGLPVVTTRHNGFPETVLQDQTGFLSPEGDPAAMAANIVRLAEDADLRQRMGAAGRTRAETHFEATDKAAELRAVLFPDGLPAEQAG